jgi:hypothetical protein
MLIWVNDVQIAPMSIGRVWMKYRQVECAPPANLRIKVDQNGGTGAWIRLMVEVSACTSNESGSLALWFESYTFASAFPADWSTGSKHCMN